MEQHNIEGSYESCLEPDFWLQIRQKRVVGEEESVRSESFLVPEGLRAGSQQWQCMKAGTIVGVHNMGSQPSHAQALSELIHWQCL